MPNSILIFTLCNFRDLLKNFVLAQEDSSKLNILNQKDSLENGPEAADDDQSPRERSITIKVNLDQKLLEMLRDIKYLQMAPYEVWDLTYLIPLLVLNCKCLILIFI